MKVKKLATGKYQVRWRDGEGKQRARNFAWGEEARDFAAKLQLGIPDVRRPKKLPKPHSVPEALFPFFDSLREYEHVSYPTCVYFLLKDGKLVYVGQTTKLRYRVKQHMKEKDFDRVLFMPVSKDKLNAVEGAVIRALKPVLNSKVPPSRGFETELKFLAIEPLET